MTDFPHPSRAGYYDLTLPADLSERLTHLVTAMVPGGEGYPSAGEAQVVRFLEEHSSEADLTALQGIADRLTTPSVAAATAMLTELEAADPVLFGWWRDFVYFGYYASHRVLAALADRGYDYHGAPQPLGYRIARDPAVPTTKRGSYQPTNEVTRVAP
ncbi:MAG: subunit 3 of gluconate 2-dehydrogenase [Frankiales bacterium]|nr:subunit 3 of gluconate 2-dehydrogenase [Frankiales bacterium]